jgi:zinc transporter
MPLDAPYGSDRNGLICGYRFRGGASGEVVDLEEARDWLGHDAPKDPSDFAWLHFNLSDAAAESWIREHLDVPDEFFEALRDGSRSTRVEEARERLIAVVNDVAFDFSFDASDISTLWVCVGPHLAVSARLHPSRSIDRLRQAVRDGCSFASPLSFLDRLMHDQGDVLVGIARQATLRVDTVEDALLKGRVGTQRAALGTLRRLLVRLQRLLAPEPAALFRLLNQPPAWVPPEDIDALRQATEEFSLVIRDVAALQERIKLLQEEITAQVAEQTNRSVFTLTVVTVLALPINIVAGLLGMNVGGIPLSQHPHGFWWVVAIVATFTVLAGWLAFRRRD